MCLCVCARTRADTALPSQPLEPVPSAGPGRTHCRHVLSQPVTHEGQAGRSWAPTLNTASVAAVCVWILPDVFQRHL